MGLSAIREQLELTHSQTSPVQGIQGVLGSWFKQVGGKNSIDRLSRELQSGGVATANQDAFLQSLLNKTLGDTQTATRSYAEIKKRFFEYQGRVTGLKDLLVLAYLAAKGPQSKSVTELLNLNGEGTRLSEVVDQARAQNVSLKKFCMAFVTAAAQTEIPAELPDVAPDSQAHDLYDRLLKLKIDFRSPVHEVLEDERQQRADLDESMAQKAQQHREEQKVVAKKKNQVYRERKELELAALEQRKHVISPYNYAQERDRIKRDILEKDLPLKNLVV